MDGFITQQAKLVASFPGLPRFFVLRFAFTILHGSRKTAKNREGLVSFITWVDTRWTYRGGADQISISNK